MRYFTFLFIITFSMAQNRAVVMNCGFQEPTASLVKQLSQVVFDEAGITVQIEVLPMKRALISAANGSADGDLTRIWDINKYFPNLYRVPLSFFQIEIISLSEKPYQFKKLKNLKNYNVGIVRGYKIVEERMKAVKVSSLIKVRDEEKLLQLLKLKRIDVALIDKSSALKIIERDNIKGLFMNKKSLMVLPMYMHMHKKSKDIIPSLTKAIRQLKQQERFKEIQKKNSHNRDFNQNHYIRLIDNE